MGNLGLVKQPVSLGNVFLNKNININTISSSPVKFTSDIIEYAESNQYMGMKLLGKQKDIIENFYYSKNEYGENKYNTLVAIAGMRSSKSTLAGIIGTFEAHWWLSLEDPWAYWLERNVALMKGDYVFIVNTANSIGQSQDTIFAKMNAMMTKNPWWVKYITWLQDMEKKDKTLQVGSLVRNSTLHWEFPKSSLRVQAEQSNSAALAGRTIKAFLSDEISRSDTSEGEVQTKAEKRSAQAVFNTLHKGTTTFKKEGRTVVVTSPMYDDDYGMQLLANCKDLMIGRSKPIIVPIMNKLKKPKIDSYLGVHYATDEFNPFITQDDLNNEKIRSPATYRRDYEAIPPSGVKTFFEIPEALDRCMNTTRTAPVLFNDKFIEHSMANPDTGAMETRKYVGKDISSAIPNKMHKFFICGDPGEKNDSFGLAMAHAEETVIDTRMSDGTIKKAVRYKTVYDFLTSWKPDKENKITVLFEDVEDMVINLTKLYHVSLVTYDRWNSSSSLQSFFKGGIPNKLLGITTPMYLNFRDRVQAGLVEFIADQEFQDTIDKEIKKVVDNRGAIIKPEGGHKDRADVLVRLDYLITQMELESMADEMTKPVKREDYKDGNKFLYDRFHQMQEKVEKKQSVWGSTARAAANMTEPGNIWGTSPHPNGVLSNNWNKKK